VGIDDLPKESLTGYLKMKIVNTTLSIATAIFVSTGAAGAATVPYGVQTNVDSATVSGWGFSECSASTYSTPSSSSINDDILGCSPDLGDYIMLAARRTGSDTFALLAATTIGFLTNLSSGTGNVTTANNGAEWYNQDNYSVGFAGLGDSVSRNSCDTASTNPELRLCWHTVDRIGGWRAGTATYLNSSTDWEKVLLVASSTPAPVPVPAGLPLLLTGLGGVFLLRRRKA
jgi:hypothetical protein